MDYLTPIATKLKTRKANLKNIIGELVIANKPNYFESIGKRWLLGKSVEGGLIGQYRSPKYRSFKMMLNPTANGNVDLILTGKLKRGLALQQQGNTTFLLYSTDKKYEKIGEKYGFEEFGLTDAEWLEMQEDILVFALEQILDESYE